MFCVKRKCSKRLERCCGQSEKQKKQEQQGQNGRTDHGFSSPSLPSYNSYVSQEPSPVGFRRQPEIFVEEITDESLATPIVNERNKDVAAKFFASYESHVNQAPMEKRHSLHAAYSALEESAGAVGGIAAGSFVLNADQINKEHSHDNALSVLKMKPGSLQEDDLKAPRLSRSYSSTPTLHRQHLQGELFRPRSFDGMVNNNHFYPHIVISNEHEGQSTTDDCLDEPEYPDSEWREKEGSYMQRDTRSNREKYSLHIPQGPHSLPGEFYQDKDAKKKRRDFALKSHSAATLHNVAIEGSPKSSGQSNWNRSSSTESDIAIRTSRLKRSGRKTGSWDERTHSDSGLGHQSSCESFNSLSKRHRVCQCRKCIKYDRRHHHSSHGKHSRHRTSANNSDASMRSHSNSSNRKASSTESERLGGSCSSCNERRLPTRRTFRRHKSVEKCDSSNSEKDYKKPSRPPLLKAKSQDIDSYTKPSSKDKTKQRTSKGFNSRRAEELLLKIPPDILQAYSNPVDVVDKYDSNDSLLSDVRNLNCLERPNLFSASEVEKTERLNTPVVNVIKFSSSDEDFPREDQTCYLSVEDIDSAIASSSKSFAPSPAEPNKEPQSPPHAIPDDSRSIRKRGLFTNNVKDSAYQTKENSTDKSNSKTTSSAPSPELGSGVDIYEKTFSAWSKMRSDERRVTSQLQLAALKLMQLQRRASDKGTGHLRVPGKHSPSPVDDELNGCLPLSTHSYGLSRRRSGNLRRLHSLHRESSLKEVTEENSPVVPEDAYQSAPESFVQDLSQKQIFDFTVDNLDSIEMQEFT